MCQPEVADLCNAKFRDQTVVDLDVTMDHTCKWIKLNTQHIDNHSQQNPWQLANHYSASVSVPFECKKLSPRSRSPRIARADSRLIFLFFSSAPPAIKSIIK